MKPLEPTLETVAVVKSWNPELIQNMLWQTTVVKEIRPLEKSFSSTVYDIFFILSVATKVSISINLFLCILYN